MGSEMCIRDRRRNLARQRHVRAARARQLHLAGPHQLRGAGRRPALEHDPEKACPGFDPGWIPVFGKDHAPAIGKDHAPAKSMIPKSGCRFSERIMLQQYASAHRPPGPQHRQRDDDGDDERAVAEDADHQREVIADERSGDATSALVSSVRLAPATWRDSQPGPAKRSNSNPAAMPMISRTSKTASDQACGFLPGDGAKRPDASWGRPRPVGTFRSLHTFS